MRSQAGKNERGFTLIEVLVALTILSVSLGVLITMISRGLETSRRSQSIAGASGLAQSLLAQAGLSMPLRLGNTTGVTRDGYSWQIHAEPFVLPGNASAAPLAAAKISMTVAWRDGDDSQSLEVSTLRLMPKAHQ